MIYFARGRSELVHSYSRITNHLYRIFDVFGLGRSYGNGQERLSFTYLFKKIDRPYIDVNWSRLLRKLHGRASSRKGLIKSKIGVNQKGMERGKPERKKENFVLALMVSSKDKDN